MSLGTEMSTAGMYAHLKLCLPGLVQQSSNTNSDCGTLHLVCSAHGTCQYDNQKNETICACEHGYRGPSCAEKCESAVFLFELFFAESRWHDVVALSDLI